MPTTTPFQLVSSSSLSSDYVASNQVLVDATSTTPVSVFRNPLKAGTIEALVVTSGLGTDSQLCYLSQDTSATTGWQLNGLTSQWGAVTASEVVAFATTWNTVEAYFTGLDGALYHMTMEAGGTSWSEPQPVDGAPTSMSALSVSYQPGATTSSQTWTLVSAVTTDLKLFGAWSTDGNWTTQETANPALSAGFGSLAVAAPVPDYSDGPWCWYFLDNVIYWVPIVGTAAGASVSAMSGVDGGTVLGLAVSNDGSPSVAIVGTSTGLIWTTATQDSEGNFTFPQGQLPLASPVLSGTVVQFTNGLANVYYVDANGAGWVVPVTGWTSQTSGSGMTYDVPTFGQPIQLNTDVGSLQADGMPADSPALIAIDADLGALNLHYQDPVTGYWRSGEIVLPSTEQYTVSRWRTEIVVYDGNGQPVPNYPLTVGANTSVDLAVGGQFAYVDSATTTTVTTNALGKATVATLATGLTTAQLTVTAADLPQSVTIAPHQGINDYMAGTGTLPGMPALNGDVLQQATVGGQPLAPALQPGSTVNVTPGQAAGYLQQLAQIPGQTTSPRASVAPGGARYLVLTKFGAGGPAYHEFATPEELEAHHARVRAALGSSFWDDVWDWAGDVWEGIKNAAISVYDASVDFEQKVLNLFVRIGEQTFELAAWAVHTVEDALHGIESIFNWVGAEVDKVVDWLKAVFDFTAIWNTKTALESGIAGFLTGMQNGVDAFSDYFAGTSNPIAQLKATLDDGFQQAEQKFSGTFSSLSGWQTPGQPPSQTSSGGAPAAATYSNNVHANWFHDQLTTNAPTTIDGTPGLSDQTTWNNLVTALGNVEGDVQTAIEAFADSFKALFTVTDPTTLGDILITDFLKAVNALLDAFLDILDALIQAVLALASVVTTALQDFLTAEISVGFLNTLYGWIAGWAGDDNPPPLTLAGLFSLVVAFPATVVFKLVVGTDQEPFPGGQLPASGGTTLASRPVGAGVECAPTTAWLAWSSQLTGAIVTASGVVPAVLLDIDDSISWASVWSTVGTIVSAVATLTPTMAPEAIDWAKALSTGGEELVAAIGVALIMGVVAFSGLLAAAFTWIRSDDAKDPLAICFTILGVVMLAYKIYCVVEDYDELREGQIASDLMNPWGNIMSFCGLSYLKDSELYPVALVLKVAGDLVGTIGSGGVSVDDLATHQPSLA